MMEWLAVGLLVVFEAVAWALVFLAYFAVRRIERQSAARLVDERSSLRSGPAAWSNAYAPLERKDQR